MNSFHTKREKIKECARSLVLLGPRSLL